jgi:hypothetical protein
MFGKYSKIEILLENGHQHDPEEEKENKIQGCHGLVHQNLINWNRFNLTHIIL